VPFKGVIGYFLAKINLLDTFWQKFTFWILIGKNAAIFSTTPTTAL
jgi:hypothetical protein